MDGRIEDLLSQSSALARVCPPTLEREMKLWQEGVRVIAGLDEVGRGPLAGPLVAAAVVLPATASWPWLRHVRDSKVLPATRRETLAESIRRDAVAFGVGVASAALVDRIRVVAATRDAMARALANLALRPEHLLIDALLLPDSPAPQTAIIHGDRLCMSIACASLVAKVARDQMMEGYDRRYPGYGLARNRGYGTSEHLAALRRLGPSPIHRRSFAPVAISEVRRGAL